MSRKQVFLQVALRDKSLINMGIEKESEKREKIRKNRRRRHEGHEETRREERMDSSLIGVVHEVADGV